jgi:hypothetical protein
VVFYCCASCSSAPSRRKRTRYEYDFIDVTGHEQDGKWVDRETTIPSDFYGLMKEFSIFPCKK